ncbi:hypothetical protein TL16_g03025 [Triparma laevis f. inornata]|uniref:PH domain-containing protein n=1 Tax=Triparma laevis f. inornata TaxID=1714386 RepID=A0A9W7A2U1_9STRA|nr:hypothetical protein TL16_g03025 [Triparma laevis f. inornata]
MSNRSLTSHSAVPPTSEFARVYINDPSLTSLTSASSAAFKLSPSTNASEVIALVNKKFSKMSRSNLFGTSKDKAGEENEQQEGSNSSGSVVVVATVTGLPTNYVCFEQEPVEESGLYGNGFTVVTDSKFNDKLNEDEPALSNSPVKLSSPAKASTPGKTEENEGATTLSLLKTLKSDDKALSTRDAVVESLRAIRDEAFKWSEKGSHQKVSTPTADKHLVTFKEDVDEIDEETANGGNNPNLGESSSSNNGGNNSSFPPTPTNSVASTTTATSSSSAPEGPLPEISVRWFFKSKDSSPIKIEGDTSGTEDSDEEDAGQDFSDGRPTSPSLAQVDLASLLSLDTPPLTPTATNTKPSTQTRTRSGIIIPSRAAFIKCGFLLNQSHHDPNVWRRKWCILTDDKLWIISRLRCKRSRRSRCIPLIRNTVKGSNPVFNIPHGIEVCTPRKAHIFMAESKSEQQSWIRVMEKRIEISSENNFIELAELIVNEEETARSNRLNTAVKSVIEDCGVPGLGGLTWNGIGKGAEIVELVRFVMAVNRYKEMCRFTLQGPSWVTRIGKAQQWEEAEAVVREFFGAEDEFGLGDIFSLYENDEINRVKTEVAEEIKDKVERFSKGEKSVAGPSQMLFDILVEKLQQAAKKKEGKRPSTMRVEERFTTSVASRDDDYERTMSGKKKGRSSTFFATSATVTAAAKLKAARKSIYLKKDRSTKSVRSNTTSSSRSSGTF